MNWTRTMRQRSLRSSPRPAPGASTGSSCTTRSRCSTRSPAISACCRRSRLDRMRTKSWIRLRTRANSSFARWIASRPKRLRDPAIGELSDEEARDLGREISWRPRPAQLPPPGDWRVWLLLAGRGFGKTRAGAEFVRAQVEAGLAQRIALVAATALDARNVMVEGESGILNIGLTSQRPIYEPSKHRLTWPNGAVATTYSGDRPDQLRGPQHDLAWCDELAAWRYPESWDQLQLGLRLGRNPRCVVTTTPRPTKIIRGLFTADTTKISVGSTYDNRQN